GGPVIALPTPRLRRDDAALLAPFEAIGRRCQAGAPSLAVETGVEVVVEMIPAHDGRIQNVDGIPVSRRKHGSGVRLPIKGADCGGWRGLGQRKIRIAGASGEAEAKQEQKRISQRTILERNCFAAASSCAIARNRYFRSPGGGYEPASTHRLRLRER